MKRKIYLLFSFLIFTIVLSCNYENEAALFTAPPSGCSDTVNISYKNFVKPILASKCYGCHATGIAPSSGGNYDLENFSTLKNFVTTNRSRFVGAIGHTTSSPMPKGAAKLPDCDIKKITKWIDGGSLDN